MTRRTGWSAVLIAATLALAGCAGQKAPSAPTAAAAPPAAQKPATAPQIANLYSGLPKPGEAVRPQAIELSPAEFECLAQAIYFEAGGESVAGQHAVAAVILNRMRSGRFPGTVCEVIRQTAKGTCQFSWWCDGKSDTPRDRDRWLLAEQAARDVLSGEHADRTHGALFFHASYVRPRWSKRLQKTAAIGNHIFYR